MVFELVKFFDSARQTKLVGYFEEVSQVFTNLLGFFNLSYVTGSQKRLVQY